MREIRLAEGGLIIGVHDQTMNLMVVDNGDLGAWQVQASTNLALFVCLNLTSISLYFEEESSIG